MGHTISGLIVSARDPAGYAAAGFFGTLAGSSVVKNLNFDNATVNSTHYAGVVAGYVAESNVVISGCSVTNSTVTSTPNLTNGGILYDNGDKAGGIIGYFVKGTIDSCTVSGTSISAYRDLGGIVGAADGGTVKNNNVKDTVLSYTEAPGSVKDDKVNENMGEVIGREVTAPDKENNTYENVTLNNGGNA